MNKEKKMNKDKKKSLNISEMHDAIRVMLSACSIGLVDTPKFTPHDDDIESSLYEEMMFMSRSIAKEVRRKRFWLFLAGFFILTSKGRKELKAQYKELAAACRYIRKHRKELKKFVIIVKLGTVLDDKGSWVSTHYSSGDNVDRRMNKEGIIERRISRFGATPRYQVLTTSCFRRDYHKKTAGEKYEQKTNRFKCTHTEEVKFLEAAPETIAMVSELMSMAETGPFKGEAEFRKSFTKYAENTIKLATNVGVYSLPRHTQIKWRTMLDRAMRLAWRKKLSCSKEAEPVVESPSDFIQKPPKDPSWVRQCIENLKNSSKPKDDDSQS